MRYKGLSPWRLMSLAMLGYQPVPMPKVVLICIADHFEPEWNGASKSIQRERMREWMLGYPRWFGKVMDSRGRPPQHSFFYPAEVYDPEHLDGLSELTRAGFGDVEVHLHHDNDESQRLRDFLSEYVELLAERHGLLSRDSQGRLRYGFIHGNWALDDSHPDGRWCGVRDEIQILIDTGCYADFTMPAAPHGAQTSTVNSIYYAVDDHHACKSHDTGTRASLGQDPPHNSLLMVQGPLMLSRRGRRWFQSPKLENGNLAAGQVPTGERVSDWLRANVHVQQREDWLFVKLHTHGAQEDNRKVLLSEQMVAWHRELARRSMEEGWVYYYVTAREMAQLVHQAEWGWPHPRFDALAWDVAGEKLDSASVGSSPLKSGS